MPKKFAAVSDVAIAGRGEGYYNWKVELVRGNSPHWLEPLLPGLLERIQTLRADAGKPLIKSLTVTAPGESDVCIVGRR